MQSTTPVDPAHAGMSAPRLANAMRFAQDHETRIPHDLRVFMQQENQAEGDAGALIGPLLPRGPSTGVVLRHGQMVASWGQPTQVGVAFSLTKCFLSAVAGIAVADGSVGDLDARVAASVPGPWFDGPHNAAITWRHLLQLTSEWHGSLFGKPDAVDWHRVAGGEAPAGTPPKGSHRTLQRPGSYWEYNDVRMNCLALALQLRLRRPLADVLRERVMGPIGASGGWSWHGYDGASIAIDGRPQPTVAAGAHWGGGMFVDAFDLARLGQLFLDQGQSGGREILPRSWVAYALTAGQHMPSYGSLWWLNRAGMFPLLPRGSFWGGGLGGNLLWIDPTHALVVVTRWIDPAQREPLLQRIVSSIET